MIAMKSQIYTSEEMENPERKLASTILEKEASALLKLARQLNEDFSRSIDCLYKIPGRIAVTGIGKSGLVGRKISATLSSTGSPSFFIHPVEASHGDLGMLSRGDALLALSYSGNTYELMNLVRYAKAFGIPIISMTRNPESKLATHSDYHLLLPDLPEADTIDCAPTTSTTMQIALGDAIAITLMKKRGIAVEDFHRWHPGGTLGQKLFLVRDLMHSGENIPLISRDALMSEAIIQMSAKGFGVIGVADTEGLAGVITDGDLRRHMHSNLLNKKVSEVMTSNPFVLEENRLAEEALQMMREKKITTIFVVKNSVPVGILHIHDLLQSRTR